MPKLHNNRIINKLIICIIAVVMICNFVVPNFAYAKTDTNEGGLIFKAVVKLVTFLCDKAMGWLQGSFISQDNIEQEDGTYDFKYSPSIIFSGEVPALDINFIGNNSSVGGDKTDTQTQTITLQILGQYFGEYNKGTTAGNNVYYGEMSLDEFKSTYGYDSSSIQTTGNIETWEYNDYKCIITKNEDTNTTGTVTTYSYYAIPLSEYNAKVDIDVDSGTFSVTKTYESTASILRGTIATWYKALRRIALVGLLSVLVYIGIRIVMSAGSPQNQSKYKKMLIDWLAALCLLFTLHYLMSFTLTITQEISNIFNPGTSDELLNTLRYKIKQGGSWGTVAGEVIMYATLVVFTVMFTIRYIKRVIYMAFFTLIAPLITLTYPLDKIKDGQAQAFTMWIREYVFNALIQVVHLVIYYVLVTTAIQLVEIYTLYAIIALMFMKQAENVVRRMFGFDKAETIGTLGAAATGGLVMNAINSLKRPPKPEKGAQGGKSGAGGSGKNVRTASKNPLEGLVGARTQGGASAQAVEAVSEQETQSQSKAKEAIEKASKEEEKEIKQEANTKMKANIGQGVKSLAGKYIGPSMKKAVGLMWGAAGGTIGLASGIAQGDFSKAIAGAAGGAAAGYYTGQRVTGAVGKAAHSATHIKEATNRVKDTWNEGAYGAEYVRNEQFDRAFKGSENYKKLSQSSGFKEEYVDKMLEAGITDSKAMEKILKNNEGNIEEAIGYYTLAKQCPDSIWYDTKDDAKLERYLEDILRPMGLTGVDAKTMREKMQKYRG